MLRLFYQMELWGLLLKHTWLTAMVYSATELITSIEINNSVPVSSEGMCSFLQTLERDM